MVDWETETEGGYSPEHFYIAAKEKDTAPVGTSVRLQTWMVRLMQTIVESRRLPYQTQSDIIRDALFHRLYYLTALLQDMETQDTADEMRQNMQALLLSHDVITREVIALEIQSQIKSLVTVCRDLGPEGIEEQKRLVGMVVEKTQGMQPFWRDRLANQIRASLGHLLPGGEE